MLCHPSECPAGLGKDFIDVQHRPHLFPEFLPILSPFALTCFLMSCPASASLEFQPANQSTACSRLVGLFSLGQCESRVSVCSVQVQELLSVFLTGLIITAEVRQRLGHHGRTLTACSRGMCSW